MTNNIYRSLFCSISLTLSIIAAENNLIAERQRVEGAVAQEARAQTLDAFDTIDSALEKFALNVGVVNLIESGVSALEAYKCYSLGPLTETKRIMTYIDVTKRAMSITHIAGFTSEAFNGLFSSFTYTSVNHSESIAVPLIATTANVINAIMRYKLLNGESNLIEGYDFIDQYLGYGHLAVATFNASYFGFLTALRLIEYARKNKIFKDNGTLNI